MITKRTRVSKNSALLSIHDLPFPAVIWEKCSGDIIDWNRSALRLFGYKASDHINIRQLRLDQLEGAARKRESSIGAVLHLTSSGKGMMIEVTRRDIQVDGRECFIEWMTDRTDEVYQEYFNDNFLEAVVSASIVSRADVHGNITYVNENFVRISGYERDELIGNNHSIINSGYHPKSFWISMWKTICSGKTWRGEVRNRAKDGTYYWVDTFIMPFKNKKGKVTEFLSIRNDITLRKLAEEELEIYTARSYETLLFGRIGSAEFDHTENTISPGRELMILLDWVGEPLGYTLPAFCERFLNSSSTEIFAKLLHRREGKHVAREAQIEVRTTTGRSLTLECRSINKGRKTLLIFHDVTEKWKAFSEKLRISKTIDGMLESITDGFFVTDLKLNFVRVNDVFARQAQMRPEEIEGRNMLDVFPFMSESSLYRLYQESIETQVSRTIEHVNPFQKKQVFLISIYPNREGLFIYYHDISAAKEAEEKLVDTYQLFNRLSSNVPGMIYNFFLDEKGAPFFPFVSQGANSLLGVQAEDLVNDGSLFFSMVHRDDLASFVESVETAFHNNLSWSHEFRIVMQDGVVKWISAASNPYMEKSGMNYWYGFMHDITEQKLARLRLAENELKNRLIVEHSGDGILFSDVAGTIFSANPEACRILGRKESDLISKGFHGMFLDQEHLATFLDLKNVNDSYKNEVPMFRSDQTVFIAEISSRVFVGNNGELNRTTIIRDISERKRAEEVREELLERFEKIAAHVPGFIYQYRIRPNGSSHFPYASKGIHEIYGVRPEEVEEDALRIFSVLHPDDVGFVTETIQISYQQLSVWRAEYRVCHPSGRVFWVEGHASPQRLEDGSVLWSGYITDITNRKKAELLLWESHSRYVTMVDNLPGFVYRVKTNDTKDTLFVSSQVESVTGFRPEQYLSDEPVSICDLIHPDEKASVCEYVRQAVSNFSQYECEYRIITRTGEERWVWEKGKGVMNDNGEVSYREGFITDITEKKKSEQELEFSKRELISSLAKIRTIINSIDGGLLMEDASRKVSFVNQKFLELFGICGSDDQIIGTDCVANIEKCKWVFNDPVEFASSVERQIIERKPVVGIEFALKDGRVFERDYIPIADAHGSHLWIYRDVTSRKLAEISLRESEALFRLLYNHTPAMMHSIDSEGRLVQVNDYWLRKLEYEKADDVLGKHFYDFLTEESRLGAVSSVLPEFLRTGFVHDISYQFVTRTGKVLDALVSAAAVRDQHGNFTKSLAVIMDVTEQKQLHREIEKLAAIAKYTSNAVIFTDLDGKINWVNDGFERITGYAREEVLGKVPGTFLHGVDTDERTIRAMREGLRRRTGFKTTILNYGKSGRKYWLDIEVMPVRNEHHEVVGFMAIESDITDLKTAIVEMQRSEQTLQTFMDHAPMVTFIKDLTGHYTFFNKAYKDFMKSKEIKGGMTDYDIFDDDFANQCFTLDQEVIRKGEVIRFEHAVRDHTFLEYKFPLRDPDDNIFAVGGISVDVTEKLEAQEKIRESEQRLRNIADHLSDGVIYQYLVDENGIVLGFPYISAQASKLFEISAEEIIEDYRKAFDLVHPEDLPAMLTLGEISRRELTGYEHEYRIVTPSGRTKWVHTRSHPRLLEDNTTLWDGLTIDITVKKNLELSVQANELRLQSILNSMLNGVIVVNAEGDVTYANQSAVDIMLLVSSGSDRAYGYNKDVAFLDRDLQPMKWEDFPVERARTSRCPVHNAEYCAFSGFDVKWISMNATPLFDTDQNFVGVVASCLDITDEKNSQTELRKVYDQLNAILNASTDSTFFLDSEYRILVFNKTGEEAIKSVYGKQVKCGDSMLDYASAGTVEDFKRNFAMALKGVPVTIEREITFANDRTTWTQVRYLPVQDNSNRIIGVSFNATDITKRKVAEQRLFESQQYFESLVNSQSSFLVRLDSEGRFTFMNRRFCSRFSLEVEDLVGTHAVQMVDRADQGAFTSVLQDCMLTRGKVRPVTLRMIHDIMRHIYWIDWEFVAIHNEYGEVTAIQGVGLDATERILNQIELQKANTRLMLATQAANMGVWELNVESGELLWNDILYKMVGLNANSPVSLQTFRQLVYDGDFESLLVQLKSLNREKNTLDSSFRIRRLNDGAIRYIRFFCVAELDLSGRLIKLIGVTYDNTEQETSYNLIRESEERFRTIADLVPVYIWMSDVGNDVVFHSKGWYEMTGSTPELELGNGWKKRIHEDDVERMMAQYNERFSKREAINLEYRVRAADGTYRWIVNTGTARWLENGSFVGYIGCCFDITERKEAEAALADKTAFLETILSTVDVGIVACDGNGTLSMFNRATVEFHGLPQHPVGPSEWAQYYGLYHLDGKTLMRPEELPLYKALYYGDLEECEFLIRSAKGTVRHVVGEGRQLKDKDGRITGAVAVMQDITLRMQTVAQLERALREKELLIKEIHHRIKNNLQLISSILYIKMSGLQSSEIREFLGETRQKIKSIAMIHERLLQTQSVNEIDIADYLGKLISDLRRTNTQQNLFVDFEISIDSFHLSLDTAIYCGLIINEVVTNAMKHAFRDRHSGTITISLSKTNGHHRLLISDNGCTLPDGVEPGKSSTFGMQFLDIFTRQINGELRITRRNGTAFEITF
jgi:PAS domain S-box-containing protein